MPIKMTPSRAQVLNAQLTTPRLSIEPVTANHAASLFEPMQEEAIYQWISAKPPKSMELLSQRWGQLVSRLSPNGDEAWLAWAVRRSREGAYVGKLDANVDSTDIATNVGFFFFPAFWGEGYASEAVTAMTDHLASHGISKMVATVTLGNAASNRVLEKAGFTQTRILPQNDTIRGVKYDDIEYVRVPKIK